MADSDLYSPTAAQRARQVRAQSRALREQVANTDQAEEFAAKEQSEAERLRRTARG